MQPLHLVRTFACVAVLALAVSAGTVAGETLAVRHMEGIVHGFLVLRAMDGTRLASGDLIQTASGERVTSRLIFRFSDGSIHDEIAVFSQRRRFRLLSYHLARKGPMFPQPLEMAIDCQSGQVTIRYSEEQGEQKTESEHMDLPPDLANGIVVTLLKNLHAGESPPAFPIVVATPKPRLIKLMASTAGQDTFSVGGSARKATHYILRPEMGGLGELVASLAGREPAAVHVWIHPGEAPVFIKSEGPLYPGGPVWRIELTSPTWSQQRPAHK